MSEISKYLAKIGARGGRKSRRTLDAATARNMVRVREARRAYRRFHASSFWSYRPDLTINAADVPWVAEQLMKHGNREAWRVAAKLCVPPIRPPSSLTDTSPDALAFRVALYARMTPAQKAARVVALSQGACRLALAGLRERYPGASPRDLFLRLAALRLGAPLVRQVYGWRAPNEE